MPGHSLIGLLLLGVSILYFFKRYFSLPRGFPRNIPIVPVHIQIYDALRGLSRLDVYNLRVRQLIEEYGAIGLWREGKWQVFITKPNHICQVLRDKTGSLERIGSYHRTPGSVRAQVFGVNIIDSDGDLHDQFSKIIKPGIQRPHDFTSVISRSSQLALKLLEMQAAMGEDAVPVRESIFEWAAFVFGESFLDLEFDRMNFSDFNSQKTLSAQHRTALGRLKDMFPFLDQLPWTWKVTRQASKRFSNLEAMLIEHTRRGFGRPRAPGCEDKLIHRMNRALEQGTLSDFHYRSNLKQLFIAGTENVESALMSGMFELAKQPELQARLHSELTDMLPQEYSERDLKQLPLLSAFMYEVFRLYPPLVVLGNRRTKETYKLGDDIVLPPGIVVCRNVYGLHTDPEVWSDATVFNPERWGKDMATINRAFRREQAAGRFIPFGLHARKCLGSAFALTEFQIGVCELVRAAEWALPTGYEFSFGGGALLAPANCRFKFRKRE
ncbi:Cytochrome p450 protein [Hapsidospora chrysogenum ATCC 11550]|uniref:Cytochrome p450 protein n=1 Tax=Hapsidospora chrysogenum (strain ATCC 11550 / CBS 779.69 / DSM 880 / IAM 14645 / JCM 23072 / IMI 49137) TaxID=857340 RepID=A0A086STY4_HAPC1|nr:Cytochrome p450 protein [Hapsidospora chrysogenum ATCC 11550]